MSEISDLDDDLKVLRTEHRKLNKGIRKGLDTRDRAKIDWHMDSRRKAEERFDANRNTTVTLPKLKYLEG